MDQLDQHGASSYYSLVPTEPDRAWGISGSGSVSLLIQGIDVSALTTAIDVHVVPQVSRYV